MLHSLRSRQLLRQEEQAYLARTAPLITLVSPSLSSVDSRLESVPVSSASSDSGVGLLSAEEGIEEKEKENTDERKVKVELGENLGLQGAEKEVPSTDFEAKMAEFATRRKNLRDGLGEQMGIFPLTLHW
jgi:hypothetical protein